eukprot:COSAG03_NODE_4835_length_1416_cov_6.002278_1_plen_94_part_00
MTSSRLSDQSMYSRGPVLTRDFNTLRSPLATLLSASYTLWLFAGVTDFGFQGGLVRIACACVVARRFLMVALAIGAVVITRIDFFTSPYPCCT